MSTEIIPLDAGAVSAIAHGFLRKSEEVRTAVKSLMVEYPFAANAAMVAGEFAIADAMTADDKAFILKCVQRGRLLIEGGKPPSDEKVFQVVAEAAAKTLTFPSKEFSVWTNGTLYIKEDGYRRLFKERGDCSVLDVEPGPPVWKKLQDRAYWEVTGFAKVDVSGKPVRVDCLIGVNGNATDGIEKILAHATRALLKRLWKKVSGIDIDGSTDGDTTQDLTPLGAIGTDAEKPDTTTDAERDILAWQQSRNGLNRMLSDNPSEAATVMELWDSIGSAKAMSDLEVCGQKIKDLKPRPSTRVLDELRRWWVFCQQQM